MISDVRLYDPNYPGPVTWAWDQTQAQVKNLKLTGGARLRMGRKSGKFLKNFIEKLSPKKGVDSFFVLSNFALYSLHAVLYSLF